MSDSEQGSSNPDQPQAGEQETTASTPEDTQSMPSPLPQPKDRKIDLLLKATGDAPIMKKKKWAVDPCKRMGWITEFIKKYLKYEASDSLFLYINQSFSPAPDVEVGTLYDCFGSDGKLVIHYCKTQAWG